LEKPTVYNVNTNLTSAYNL